MAQDHGSQTGSILKVGIAIDIPYPRALPTMDVNGEPLGILVITFGIGVGTTRDQGMKPRTELSRMWHVVQSAD
jgi:hypothetical protein